jgi:hypothetical protein
MTVGEVTAGGRLATLAAELQELRATLRMGGGEKRIERQHEQGKLTARERSNSSWTPTLPGSRWGSWWPTTSTTARPRRPGW